MSVPPRIMRDCPRYNTCSVPICPLDPDWQKRTMCPGEPTCPWLLEAVKLNAQANFEYAEAPDLLPWALQFTPIAAARFGQIRRAVESAKTSGSRIAAGRASGQRFAQMREAGEPSE